MYEPEGDGMQFFATVEERDRVAKIAIANCLDSEGWDEFVEDIVCGEVTHKATQVEREDRPEDSELDDDGMTEDGSYWDNDYEFKCNYKLLPLGG
jgi:hypothetical protein